MSLPFIKRLATVGLFALMVGLSATGARPDSTGSSNSSSPARPEKALRFASNWSSEANPAFAPFNAWTNEYLQTSGTRERQAMVQQGVILAQTRRATLSALIETNPREALASTVPAAVRDQLPTQITSLLEQRVEGTGDFEVMAALPVPGRPVGKLIERTVKVNGVTYQAFVYGQRKYLGTKYQLPVNGVALDGKLALSESPLRLLDPGEALAAGRKVMAWRGSRKPTTQVPATAIAPGSTVVQSGADYISIPPATPVATVEAAMLARESTLGPAIVTAQDSSQVTNSAWTMGNKTVLVIRVDFSDLPGADASASSAQSVMDSQVSPWYLQCSFNQTSQTTTVSTKVYRMPQTASYYAINNANDQLHTDAENLAGSDYTVANYDRVVVDFPNIGSLPGSQITYGGLGDVGGPRVWINGYFQDGTLEHELGHTYGLWHAHLWQVTDGDPVSPNGTPIEYGDPFDQMGSGNTGYFNAWSKYRLQWLTDSNVTVVSSNGTYRVGRFDGTSNTGIRALEIKRDATRNYWIGLRKVMPSNESSNTLMPNDAYVIWGYNDAEGSNLIDTQTPGTNPDDAGLPVGATLNDTAAGITIKTVDEGGAAGSEYLDVAVTFATYPLTVASSPGDGGLETGGGVFPVGSSQTVTATANSGYAFANWTESGTIVSSSSTYTFNLNLPTNLIANYTAISPITWQTKGSMTQVRVEHTATLLANGQVLVAGGTNGTFLTQGAELYDPTTGLWTGTASLLDYFYRHTAVLLSTGQVLVAYGGYSVTAGELYNPGTSHWSNTGNLIGHADGATATLLPNGEVLVAGGLSSSSTSQATAELYNSTTGTWTPTGSLNISRYGHTATLLPNGKVLVAGGYNSTGLYFQTSAELYDSSTGTWTLTGSMANSRYQHTATLLNTGQVILVGGTGNSGLQSSAELYDPTSGTWSNAASLNTARDQHTANLLPDGEVLVTGGSDASGNPLGSTELYYPANDTWTPGPNLNAPRYGHTATSLANGSILVAGGQNSNNTVLSSSELYAPFDKLTQTITFAPIPNKSTASASFSPPATASSSLPVSISRVSGPASVLNNVVTITGTGVVTLQADQGGDTNYAAAPSVQQSFTVEPTLSQWESTYGLNNNLAAAPYGDGVPNLFKYLYHIDPSRAMTASDQAALPVYSPTVNGTTTVSFREQSLASGVTLNVQTSTDLQNWTNLTQNTTLSPTTYTIQQVRSDPNTNDPIMQVNLQSTGAPKLFFRLNLTQP